MARLHKPAFDRADKAYKAYRARLAKAVRELKARWEKREGKRLRYAVNNSRRRAVRVETKLRERRKKGPGRPSLLTKGRK